MAFLQVKNNLGDIHNICDAQNNLGLLNMAYQCKCNVDIYNGSIRVSSLRLNNANVRSNYVLVADNDLGDVVWKEQLIQPWMTQSPSDILLSTLSNDENFIKSEEVNVSISNYIETFRDTLIDNNLRTSNVAVSNLVVDSSFLFNDGTTVLDSPCILTNNGYGSNVYWSKIVQSYSNDNSSNVVSAQAVSNLHNIVNDLVVRLPDDNGDFVVSNKNLSDILSSNVAVANLGLNDNFHTKNITLSNVFFQESSRPVDYTSGKKYYMMRNDADQLEYYDYRFIHSFTDSYREYPASSSNVNHLYLTLTNRINECLLTSNVLGEFFEGENNPFTDVFRNRLRQAGVQEVAFTSNWEDLGNRPKKLSGFCNLDFQDETMFIYAKSNLSDIRNTDEALINLGVSMVGRTGNFRDLVLPISISNIVEAGHYLDDILGVPFLVRTCNLEELVHDAGKARSNLGIRNMATFDNFNVNITGGNITVSDCIVKSNLMILASNDSLEDAAIDGSNIFLKCNTSDGNARWTYLPEAKSEPIVSQGIVFITNDLGNPSSNTAITSYAISNAFYNNDNISNLVPLSSHEKFGIVKTTSEYANPSLLGHMVLDTTGIKTMYDELTDALTTYSNFATPLIHSKLTDISVSNYLLSFSFLQLNDVDVGLEQRKEISLNFPGDANDYLCADGSFKTIKNISVSNNINYQFLQINPTVENNIDVMQISLLFPNTSQEFLCGDGRFKVVTPTRLSHDGVAISNNILVRSENNNVSINSIDNSITIKNIAINDVNENFFTLRKINTWTEIDSIKGAIVGNTSGRLTGLSNEYLKCIGDDLYDFVEIDLEPFTTVSQGLVPTPLDEDSILLNTGWVHKNFLMENWLSPFEGNQRGVVVPFSATTGKEDHFLNANGTWTHKQNIFMDIDAIANRIRILPESVNVFQRQIVDFSEFSEIQMGLKPLDSNSNNKLITYRDNVFVWDAPVEVLKNYSGFNDGVNAHNSYLNAEGNFTTVPNSYDFTASMTLEDSTLKIKQTLDLNIPVGEQTTTVVITHENINGLYNNYIHRQDDIIYFNGTQYVKNSRGGDSYTISAGNLNDINTNIITDATLKDVAFTTSGTAKLIDLYISNFKESNGTTETATFDENHFFTTNAIKTYLENYYVNQSEILNDLSVDDESLIDIANYTNKIVSVGALSNYINSEKVFAVDGSFDTNAEKLVRAKNITWYLNNNFVNQSEILNDLSVNDDSLIDTANYTNKIVSVGALSNYINSEKVFDEDALFVDNSEKLVRAKNITWYLDELRTDDSSYIVDFSTNNNVKFITPYAVALYTGNTYIKIDEILADSDDIDSDVNSENKIISSIVLKNYINIKKVFDENALFVDNSEKLVRAKNVTKHFINKTDININSANIDGEDSNVKTKVVSTKTLHDYINNTKVFNENALFDDNSEKLVRAKNVTRHFINKTDININSANIDEGDSTVETKVVSTKTLHDYINNTKVFADTFELTSTSTLDKLVRHKNIVKYVNDLRLTSTLVNSDPLLVQDDNRFVTARAITTIVGREFVSTSSNYDYNGNAPINEINSTNNYGKFVSVKGLRNVLFNESTGTQNEGGIIQNETDYFVENKAFSSQAIKTYLSVNLEDYIPKTKIVTVVDDNYTIPSLTHIQSNYIQKTKIVTVVDDDEEYDNYTIPSLTHIQSDFIQKTKIVTEGVEEYDSVEIPSLALIHSSFILIEAISTKTQFLNLDREVDPILDYSSVIDEPTLYNVLYNSFKKINSVSGDADNRVFGFNDGQTDLWTVNDDGTIENNLEINTNCIPTLGYMNSVIDFLITERIEAGGEVSFNSFEAQNLTVFQTMTFALNNVDRTEAVAETNFMTIDSTGLVVFKKVDHLAGSDANVTRPEDTHSMTTGENIHTFNEYQFIAGAYNSSNNIYKTMNYVNPGADKENNVYFAVGTGTSDSDSDRKNGFEVHNTGEVFVGSNLILGNTWRLSFNSESLSIEKFDGTAYIQKHIFK